MKLLIIPFLILFGSCNSNNIKYESNKINYSELQTSKVRNFDLKTRNSSFVNSLIDTAEFISFWVHFQSLVKNNKEDEVLKMFQFPIHAINAVIFKYSCDCDTAKYIQNEEKYREVEISQNNFIEYYSFIFTKELKFIIQNLTAKEILKASASNTKSIGFSYTIFPKEHDVKVNCPNDHNLKFHFIYSNSKWSITLGGL